MKFSNPEECKTKPNYTDCLKEKFSVYAKPNRMRAIQHQPKEGGEASWPLKRKPRRRKIRKKKVVGSGDNHKASTMGCSPVVFGCL